MSKKKETKTRQIDLLLSTIVLGPETAVYMDLVKNEEKRICKKAVADKSEILVCFKDPEEDKIEGRVGVLCRVIQLYKIPNKVTRVSLECIGRAQIVRQFKEGSIDRAEIKDCDEWLKNDIDPAMSEGYVIMLDNLLDHLKSVNEMMNNKMVDRIIKEKNLLNKVKALVENYPFEQDIKQNLLEEDSLNNACEEIGKIIYADVNGYALSAELYEKVQSEIDKDQKEYLIREQIAALKKELGAGDEEEESELDKLKKRIDALEAPDEIKANLYKSLEKYKKLYNGTQEANVELVYLETLLSLPWNHSDEENHDLEHARKILERDYYGMKKVKERIIESLAVRNVTHDGKAPIICLVGPPGTGKTSIAKSIAQALGRKYARVCLGGVRDEAEIRGHRKTYLGAMPGRIIDALKRAKSNNPLMLLDEVDKMSNDYRSDTAAALLEVLDGEQNKNFIDHYIELPVDLSNVLFIATANDISELSQPLLDRMDVIELDAYTEPEKLNIAKKHLVPKQLKANGLNRKYLRFQESALKKIIEEYTYEAGVRDLERQIGTAARKVLVKYYDGSDGLKADEGGVTLTDKNLFDYLGAVKYIKEPKRRKNEIGIVNGLAWTQGGGDTLEIEVNSFPGKPDIILTGNMGDVMKESAQIAISYVRLLCSGRTYHIDKNYFDEHTIHIHIPEGAIPKDGPSAGVTMATAILSAVKKIPVRHDIAMTGEITLRGRVLPIGGLKEKILAAKSMGIKTLFVPDQNRNDVAELDEDVKGGVEIIFVSEMKQILDKALVQKK